MIFPFMLLDPRRNPCRTRMSCYNIPVDPLTRTVQPFKWKRSRKPLSQEVRSTYRTLMITLLILGSFTTGTYLYMSSLQPVKGYELKELQTDYEALQSDLRKLEHQVIEAKSFIHLESENTVQEMEVVGDDEYSFVEEANLAENTTR